MSKSSKLKISLVFVVCLLCVLFCGAASAEGTGNVSYTETPVYIDGLLSCRGYTVDGETYVSLESACAVLGYDVEADYDIETNKLTVQTAGIEITACKGEHYFTANDRCLYLPHGYMEIDGAFIVPLDALGKIFNLSVSLNEELGAYDFSTANEQILESGDEYYDEDDLYWLGQIITWESGNQPVSGQIGVGNVVLNRVESERFPNSIKDVIFQPGQFQPVETGAIYGDPYPISIVCAKLVLEGYSTVADALFFHVGHADVKTISYDTDIVINIADHNFLR